MSKKGLEEKELEVPQVDKGKKQGGDIKSFISSKDAKSQFALALPKHLGLERFIRIALTALTKTPKLMQCTQESLFGCLLDLSQLGLEPDGRKAHLIPYGDQCTLIIDYKGLVDLARRSGEIVDIHADVVCKNDVFKYSFGSEGKLIHKPAISKRGEPIAAYSFVKLKDGSSSYEVMNKEEVNAIRERSKAKHSGPWVTDWKEMAKKTVFRRHSKWLPVASEKFQEAVEKDFDVPVEIGDASTTKPGLTIPHEPREKKEEEERPDEKPEAPEGEQKDPGAWASEAQLGAIKTLCTKKKISEKQEATILVKMFGEGTSREGLSFEQASQVITYLNK